MAKVITFSRNYPGYHPKAGQPTFFVEKFCKSINHNVFDEDRVFDPRLSVNEFDPKHHTIRAGHRWKAGEFFSPRVWGGKPYNSKQIVIGPDTEIKKVWNIKIFSDPCQTMVLLPTTQQETYTMIPLNEVAKNDGLTNEDFISWFNPKLKDVEIECQIICWNESIEY